MSLPPTNAEIAYQQSGLLDRWTLYTTQLRDWLGGTATGGPNGDGTYPLQDSTGLTFYVPCAAAWQAKVDAITDPLTGLQATVDQSVADAQAAETAAQTSETNAAASATAAQSASSDASMYATNSANSAADSLTYKNAVATSETNAANSATAAATSETNAANSATAAANSATNADNDAIAADQSAQDAAASAQQAATYAAGRLTYIGSWDVSGGTLPAIGNKGDFYAITGTATINGVEYANGDMAVSDGSTGFDKIDNTDKVTSVAGLIGTIGTAQLQTALNLGTAAYQPTTAFATAAQGAKADTALQDASAFATAAQGTAADNAMPKAGGSFTGWTDAPGVRANTTDHPPSGAGCEVQYNSSVGAGFIIAYDRTASAYKTMVVGGSQISFQQNGVSIMDIATGEFVRRKNANSTTMTVQPRIFVQSADPGAAAADGDLWIW